MTVHAHQTKRTAGNPIHCQQEGCDGRIIMEHPTPVAPLMPVCNTCHTPVPAARERLALMGWGRAVYAHLQDFS